MRNVLCVSLIVICCWSLSGCAFNTHGNRKDDRRLLTRARDLRHFVNKQVTLIGTARDGAIDLRGGTIEVPAYDWPEGYVGQRVSVTGTVFEQRDGTVRTYRLGEVETSSRWSR